MSNRSLVRAGLLTIAWIFSLLLVVDSFNRAWAASCGDTFNGPGTITLDSDVGPCSGFFGIEVRGGTLNMAGHTVSCDGHQGSIGVEVEGSATKVSGGTVMNCDIGIDWDTDGGTLTKNHAIRNQVGFVVGGDKVKTTKNTATGNETGFVISGNSDTVKGNVAKNNGGIGFQITTKSDGGSLFEKNTADENDTGFDLKGGSNTLTNNTATDNFDGFDVEGGSNTLTNNTATGGFLTGIFVDGDRNKLTSNTSKGNLDGIGINGEFNTLEQNTANSNEADGIFINSPFAGNLVSGNKATGNAFGRSDKFDLDDFNDECTSNEWKKNKFHTKNPSCIR